MFRTFIYLDEDKLYAYKRLIDGKNEPRLKDVTKKKSAYNGRFRTCWT